MKKFIAMLLSLMLVFSLAGCTSTTEEEVVEETQTAEEITEETTEEETMSEKSYMLGVAAMPKSNSMSATDEKDAVAAIETSMMAIIFDMDGKVMDVSFDVTEQMITFADDGTVAGDIELRTKSERGEDYGLKAASGIGKEIDEQFMALEEWMVGKTIDEIADMSADDEDLKAGVTIMIDDYIMTAKKAYENAMPLAEMPTEVALGTSVLVTPQEGDGAEKGASVEVTTTFVGLATDGEGKIIDIMFDAAQQFVAFDAQGQLAGEVDLRTKVEKGPDYNMIVASPIEKELFEQYAALEDYAVGQTVDEVLGMPTYEKDAYYPNIPDVEDLKASVTIDITDLLKALESAKMKLS